MNCVKQASCVLFFLAGFFLTVLPAAAQPEEPLEIPVSYDLGVAGAPPIEGYLTGGALATPEGINVHLETASAPEIIDYLKIDKIADLRLSGLDQVLMRVYLKSGDAHNALLKVRSPEPILILRDETASGTTQGRERVFRVENFKGIPLLKMEAAIPFEAGINELKDLSRQFLQTLEAKDLDKAIDIHNRIGEILDGAQEAEEGEDDDDEKGAEEEAGESLKGSDHPTPLQAPEDSGKP
jgi:hypothetical protein